MSSGPKTRGSYGPNSPRGQALAQKQRDAMQAVKNQDMAKKMREAYENFQKSAEADTIGLKKGGKVAKFAKGGHPDVSKRGSAPFGGNRSSTVRSGGAGTNQPYYQRSTGRDGSTVTVEEVPMGTVTLEEISGMKKGGKVKKMRMGGSASSRADGCAVRGKTRGKIV